MKGLAMKVGQILSYMDVGLPEDTVGKLAKLQTGVSPLDAEVIRAQVQHSLGAPLEQLFERFDGKPVAAASVGQVHRARFAGNEVAVKVRYPGVEQTLVSDFARLVPIARLASVATQVDGQALVAELRDRMRLECDYGQEAAWQRAFAQAFADDSDLRVPGVVASRSTGDVLTTHWCDGQSFEKLCEEPPLQREAAARTLARFAFMSVFAHGALQADPHPGNFIFRPAGEVVALDFGCVRPFDAEVVEAFRAVARCVVLRDRSSFRDAVVRLGIAPRPRKLDWDGMWAMMGWMFEPYLEARFRFERSWWQSGLHFTRPSNRNLRHQALPPQYLWLQRMQFGLHAVLLRLDVEVALRDVLLDTLEQPLKPITPIADPRGGPEDGARIQPE